MCQHSALRHDVVASQPVALTWTTPPPAPAEAATAALAGFAAAAPQIDKQQSRNFASTGRCLSATFWSSLERDATTGCYDPATPSRGGALPSPPLTVVAQRTTSHPHGARSPSGGAALTAAAAAATSAAVQMIMSSDVPSWNPNITPSSGQMINAMINANTSTAMAIVGGSGRMVAPTVGYSFLCKRDALEDHDARLSDREPFFAGISDSQVTRGLLLEEAPRRRCRRRVVKTAAAACESGDLEPPEITAMHSRDAAVDDDLVAAQRFSQHFAQQFGQQRFAQHFEERLAKETAAREEENRPGLLLPSCGDDCAASSTLADEAQQQHQLLQHQHQLLQHQQLLLLLRSQHKMQTLAASQAGKGILAVPLSCESDRRGKEGLQRSTLSMASLLDGQRGVREGEWHRVRGEGIRMENDLGCTNWVEGCARQSTFGGARREEHGREKQMPLEQVLLQSWLQAEQRRAAERREAEDLVMDRNGLRRKRLHEEEEKLSALLLASHQAVMQQQREQLALQQRQKLVLEQSRQLALAPSFSTQQEPQVVAAPFAAESFFTCGKAGAARDAPAFFGPGKGSGAYVSAASCSGTTTSSFGGMSPPSRPLLDLNLRLSLSSLSSEETPDTIDC